jgi:hypothetical protein
MRLIADDDINVGSAEQSVAFNISADVSQYMVARGEQRGEVRHLSSRHKAHAPYGWQSEDLF